MGFLRATPLNRSLTESNSFKYFLRQQADVKEKTSGGQRVVGGIEKS